MCYFLSKVLFIKIYIYKTVTSLFLHLRIDILGTISAKFIHKSEFDCLSNAAKNWALQLKNDDVVS
jgi:hypothetical protein